MPAVDARAPNRDRECACRFVPIGLIRIVLVIWVTLSFGTSAFANDEDPLQRRLLRMLTGRSEKTRLSTLTQLQQKPDVVRGVVAALIDAGDQWLADATPGSEVPASVAALLRAVGSTHTDPAAEFLARAAGSDNDTWSLLAIDQLGKNHFVQAIDALDQQTRRDVFENDYGYRFTLVRALVRMDHPDAHEVLTRLAGQLDGQLRHEIRQALPEPEMEPEPESESESEPELETQSDWVRAPDANGGAPPRRRLVEPASYESLERAKRRPRLTPEPNYYGIGLHAARMLFVIDRSGSMKEASGYATRLDDAKDELIRTINELPESTEFSILFFDTRTAPWRTELKTATPENRLDACAFVRRLTPGAKTNTHAALVEAIGFDPQLEAVFLLSDGQPTAGDVRMPSQIVADIVARNEYRHVRFHTIGVGVTGTTKHFLRSLAESTGGEFRDVE